jgi:ArsR family transcriptional regulator, arsenate/arsenite/antimonite-responsive transcriptional repressor
MDSLLTWRPTHNTVRNVSNYQTDAVVSLANAFKALSNPKRLVVFQLLLEACAGDDSFRTADGVGICVDELARQLGLAKSTISHHLKELRVSGLISVARKGKFNEFKINWDFLAMAASLLGGSCCGVTVPSTVAVTEKESE